MKEIDKIAFIYLKDGKILIWYAIFAAWGTDTFAYAVGMKFGKHKLTKISPKKSIEGSIGGIVFCAGAYVLWAYIIDITYIGLPIIILAGIIASCVSQIGDLSMSAIKRKQGIKDFGRLFPGHVYVRHPPQRVSLTTTAEPTVSATLWSSFLTRRKLFLNRST